MGGACYRFMGLQLDPSLSRREAGSHALIGCGLIAFRGWVWHESSLLLIM